MDGWVDIGIKTRDLILHAAALLRMPEAPGIFCIALVATLVIVCGFFGLTVRSKFGLLQEFTRLLREDNSSPPRFDLDEISNVLAGKRGRDARHLAETWEEFRETTLDRDGEGSQIKNSVRPSVFFNLEDMGFGVAGWRFWPSLFVSIGLAATFLGLIAALQETGESLKAGGNQEIVLQALTQLLTVASAKFIMSLTGLLCSILFTVVLRIATRMLDNAIRRLAHEIERRMRFVSLEKLAQEQLRAVLEQREHNERLNENLIEAISEPLRNALGSTTTQIGEMVATLAGSLSDGLAAAMTRASDRLDAASEKLAGLASEINSSSQQFTTASEQAAAGFINAASRLESVTENLSKAGNGLADAARPVALAAEKTATTTQLIADASVEMVESAKTALESEKDVVVMASTTIQEQIKTFESRAAAYDGQLEKVFRSFSEEITRAISEVQNLADGVHDQYAEALATLQAVIENAKAFEPESARPTT